MTDTDLLIQNLRRENEWLKKRIELAERKLAEAEKRLREVGADDGDYINRTALLHDIEQSVVYTVREKITSAEMRGAHKIIERIKCAPAVEPIYIHEPTKSEFKRMAAQMGYVPVVRCKDCKHAERYERTDGTAGYYCGHPQNSFTYGERWDRVLKPVKETDGFCSYGARKDEEND